jgi:hypothetical protein
MIVVREVMTVKANVDIRSRIKKSGFYAWQVAEKLGVHENTFFRMLRKELSEQKKCRVNEAIKELSGDSVPAKR